MKRCASHRSLSNARELLEQEIVQVTGCTEPASVAFAFMTARRHLRTAFDPRAGRAILFGSHEVLRNASTAVVPFLNRRGLRTVAAAGLSADARSFNLFPSVKRDAALAMLRHRGWLTVRRAPVKGVYVKAVLHMAGETVEVVIAGHHDEIRSIRRNGRIVHSAPPRRQQTLDMRGIMSVVAARDPQLEAIAKDLIVRQVRGDPKQPLIKRVPALIRARMCGSASPVMTITGSGNHGIFLGVPFYDLYRTQGSKVLAAALLTFLAGIHMTARQKRISEDCGLGTKAAPALAAGLAFARGASPSRIIRLMNSVSACLRKLECHGARSTCGGKARKALSEVLRQVERSTRSTR